MKKRLAYILTIFFLAFSFSLVTTSCGSNKTGCPINEEAHVKPDRKGRLPKKEGQQHLFSKKARKRMKKKS